MRRRRGIGQRVGAIPQPDLILKMPKAVPIPARGDVEYTYEIVPTGFKTDRWVRSVEILPLDARERTSRGRVCTAAGFEVDAARTDRNAVHSVDAERS